MNAPNNKFPYNRRIPRHKRKRQPKSAALKNPYLESPSPTPSFPRTREPSPRISTVPSPRANQNRLKTTEAANPTYAKKPVKFAQHVLQRPTLAETAATSSTPSQITEKSPSDPATAAGKTFTAAVAVLWWLMSYDNAIVITTAPSERQVKELLWREIRQLYMPHRDIIGGKLTRTRLDFAPNRYAYGFSTNTEDRFQGFHSGNILVIVDEASGVDEFIYYAIDGILTTQNAKLLMIGNPHGLAGTFYDAFHKNRKQFHTVHISAFDTPAFTEAGITAENIADLEYPDPVTDTDVIPADNTVIPADAGTQGNTNHANSHIPLGLSTPRWA